MKQIVYIVIILFFIACENSSNSYKPKSSGNIHTISVVIDDNLWKGSIGNQIRNLFSSEFEGLPQQEPMFSLIHIPTKVFADFAREGRNIIQVSKSNIDTSFITKNKYAAPQIVLSVKGKSSKKIIEQLNSISAKAKTVFTNNEIREKQKRIKKSVLKTDEFKAIGVGLTLPSAYKLFKKDKQNKLWFQRETKKGSVNILVYKMPLSSGKIDLERIIKIRDSIGKEFVPGRNEGSYIVTEKAYRPFYKKTKIKNNDAYETKGTWEVVNDYMAGPFLNYYIEDAKNNRALVIEGFVFSPSDRKREYMVEIAAIIKSLVIL